MNGHTVMWSQPPALSSTASRLLPAPRAAFQRPAILRFTNDGFMQEFLTMLDTAPERMSEYKVRRETWRGFEAAPVPEARRMPSIVLERLGISRRRMAPGSAATAAEASAGTTSVEMPLKLYQPAHQRHYLVACSLVCGVAGLPDREVEPGRGEQTGWVLRRLLPATGDRASNIDAWAEYAWVAKPQGYVWQKVGGDATDVLEGEERLPLFAVHFAENERRRRRLFAGVIPVGRREAYLGAPKSSGTAASPAGITPRTSRKILLRKEVIEPWKALVGRADHVRRSFVGPFVADGRAPNNTEKAARLRIEREQIQTASWFILLDFAKYLATYLEPVWRAVLNPSAEDRLTPAERAVVDALERATLSSDFREILRRRSELAATDAALYDLADVIPTLRQALARFGAAPGGVNVQLERQLEGVDQPYDRYDAGRRALYPDFLFPLADPDRPNDAPRPPIGAVGTLSPDEARDLALDEDPAVNDPLERLDKFAVLILRALRDDQRPAPEPAVPAAAIPPADPFEAWFVIRCVYERPGCAPLHEATVSRPTEPFQMAGFFDPDAPARPIRIGLPIDTTPGGLRKFDKNTAFVISNTLCGQIRRLRGLTLGDLVLSVLPWPLHKDLPVGSGGPCSVGMICSLSIPIITICALILLMVMVTLLELIFRWTPFFTICFSLPGLTAKPPGSSSP